MLLDQILINVPCPIFWKDLNGIFLGCNQLFLSVGKFHNYSELVGKSDKELPWGNYADEYYKDDQYVITTGKTLTRIEEIPLNDRIIVSETTKTPLIQDNKVIGVLGICLDITAQKKSEQLAIENESHKTQLAEKEKFSKVVDQVAHDIRSPLASLLMIVKSCSTIPEKERIALRDAANSINDIANNLLHQYKVKEKLEADAIESSKQLLVSASLLEVLTDKKYQYQSSPVNFQHVFEQSGYFAFIKINVSDFKRMISNLINNAVDALDGREGKIILKLEADRQSVKLIIQDNGKGMPPEVINKIMNNIAVTEGKKEGHGIGMTQIRQVLEATQAKMNIQSVIGQGTSITLIFPRIDAPHWIAEEIILNQDDLVVILDDDSSIHGAWDTHFESILKTEKNIHLEHFKIGQDALEFINSLSFAKKKKVFLLSDHELLKQDLTGLDVIRQSGISRAILVTSHYANQKLLDLASTTDLKILPKQMAAEVSIKVNIEIPSTESSPQIKSVLSSLHTTENFLPKNSKQVDLVIIEDNHSFAESIIAYLKEMKSTEALKYQIDHYTHPHTFLENLSRYPKDTKISLDNEFGVSTLNGLQLAQQLYERGYTNLYLLSGKEFEAGEIPHYVIFILKTDLDGIAKI